MYCTFITVTTLAVAPCCRSYPLKLEVIMCRLVAPLADSHAIRKSLLMLAGYINLSATITA